MTIGHPPDISREDGVALIVVLLAVIVISTLGVVVVLTTSAETLIAAGFRRSEEALYSAEAGAERSLDDLRSVSDWSSVLDGSVTSTFVDGPPGGTRTLDDGSMIDLAQVVNLANCQQKVPCTAASMDAATEDRPWGANNPRWMLFAYGRLRDVAPPGDVQSPFYCVVMVSDDPGETDGNPARDGVPGQPGSGVIAVRAEAFGPGEAHKVIELTVAHGAGAARVLSWREVR